MEDTLVSFETAKLANQKGYPVYNNYSKSNFYNRRTKTLIYFGRAGQQTQNHLYGAPTQSLLQKWLREEHKLWALVYFDENTMATYCYFKVYSIDGFIKKESNHTYKTYEETLEEGLLHTLKLIK